jgi:NAD(P)-dependent dehydrogenase (short-subunit alcohol dehydrogenase family)
VTGELSGRVIVVTGATSGLGKEATRALAALGPRLYLVARDPARGEATIAGLTAETGNRDLHLVVGDLACQARVHDVADELLATGDPIHVLLNNAGMIAGLRRTESPDGIESTFALNHLAYFTLTLLVLARLQASTPARIVNVASDAYKDAKGRFDFDDYDARAYYSPLRQYGRSKLANILFTRELARRVEGSGVTANAAAPPRLTATRFAHNVHPLARVALTVWSPFALSPKKGAAPLVHLCRAPEVEGLNGTYWSGMRQPELQPAATNDDDARRLWALSESLTGVRA